MTTNTQIENLALEEIPLVRNLKILNENPEKTSGEEYYSQQEHSPCGIPRERYGLQDKDEERRKSEFLRFIRGSKYRAICQ